MGTNFCSGPKKLITLYCLLRDNVAVFPTEIYRYGADRIGLRAEHRFRRLPYRPFPAVPRNGLEHLVICLEKLHVDLFSGPSGFCGALWPSIGLVTLTEGRHEDATQYKEKILKILITGGAGFIGSAVIRHIISHTADSVVNVDKLTYAGNLESLESVSSNHRYAFEHVDICDRGHIDRVFATHRPDVVMHLAAESHVDRSISGPSDFITTNIIGTYTLLEASRSYWNELSVERKSIFRFHHISTDEVYGDLENPDELFTENTPYKPSSPYSASKASSDHLVRAWHRTYGLPVVVTNCSNNYGPYHFPEKLIPLVILNALAGKPLPIYGKGDQVRDWLYVDDHARALHRVAVEGRVGETYNIGGHNEKTNLEVVCTLCELLDELLPASPHVPHAKLITYVQDRPGHDQRYAIDASKIQRELGWTPMETFESGIRKTVIWYLNNPEWIEHVLSGTYQKWIEQNYTERTS